ncbi:GLPGLI family protein [Flavobacterium caeni]|uniref:GLPGLI family protein n=1 Tax=Flavobacterium caeni TaxID=490189 RepID=A0A1G5JS68_9FLAO|nr:GLPGLI family protein [Flavobacterium caeni]SCY91235.1 GLPGLI family protein [Flavobacterium caeni]
MKQILLAAALFAATTLVRAQDFQGMAVYESKTSTSDIKTRMESSKELTPEMRAMAENMMKKMFEKTFILNFDKTTSVYKEEEKLEAPGQNQVPGRMMSSMLGGGGTFYKNVKDKTYTVDKEFMGKEFLVKDSLPKLDWKMESETKQIGGYNCFKATAVRKASKSDIRNFRPKKADDKKDAKPEKEKTTNLMDDVEVPDTITITAWYTPEIPIAQGPENYWGLPGLILEASDDKTTILCSKIVLNAKEKVAIKAPTNGKVVNQKEYDEIVIKKMEELREMQGRNGGFQMRIGN